jgi:hypothetical protein
VCERRSVSNENEAEAFDPVEFMARVIMHIPEPRRHLVRHCMWYSNVSRGKRLKAASEQERDVDSDTGLPSGAARAETRDTHAIRRSWA